MPTRQERHRARIQASRKRRWRHRRRSRRRTVLLVIVAATATVAVVVAVVVTTMTVRRNEGDAVSVADDAPRDRPGAPVVAGAPTVAISRTPTNWHVVYRLEERSGDRTVVSTDEVWVRRPFDSRLVTRRGAPPGGEEASFQVGTFGRRTNGAAGSTQLDLQVPPAAPPSDVRVASVLPRAVEAGLAERREVRSILGRRCQVYRLGSLFGEGPLRPPAGDRRSDSCVDDAGLVLEEVLFGTAGDVVSRRVAVSVEEEVALADDLFPIAPSTLEASVGGGAVRALVPGTSAPGEFFEADAPPVGFEYRGRYSVVPPQPENFRQDDPLAANRLRAAVADVWVRGPDFVVLEQGGTRGGSPPFSVDAASPSIDLGPLGQGEIVLSGHGATVRALRPGGQYVAVTGSVDAEELASVARSLRAVEGTPLQFAD